MELLSVLQLVVCLLTSCNRTSNTSSWSNELRSQQTSSRPNATMVTQLTPLTTNLSQGAESTDDSDNEVILDDAFLANGRRSGAKERKRLIRSGLTEEFPVQQQEDSFGLDDALGGTAGHSRTNVDGGSCRFNGDCESGCCLAAERTERKCAPKVLLGGRCEVAQIKGGYYADFCPCQAGDGACAQTQGRKGGGRHMSCLL